MEGCLALPRAQSWEHNEGSCLPVRQVCLWNLAPFDFFATVGFGSLEVGCLCSHGTFCHHSEWLFLFSCPAEGQNSNASSFWYIFEKWGGLGQEGNWALMDPEWEPKHEGPGCLWAVPFQVCGLKLSLKALAR